MVIALGFTGILKKPAVLVTILALLLLLGETSFAGWELNAILRLTAMFISGALFLSLRQQMSFSWVGASVSATALLLLLSRPHLSNLAVAAFGAYLIFWFAAMQNRFLNHINNEIDLSYGTYLYAWPVGSLLIWYLPWLGPLWVLALTLLATYPLAWISWHTIEKPCISFKGPAVKLFGDLDKRALTFLGRIAD
jgi:peptidoglycan/LPS O-acetylase OafA/YrhL